MTPKHDEANHSAIRAALRGYIDKWEAWEQENHREASIPNVEWNALMVLAKHTFEQDVDDSNYIGKLLERGPQIGPIIKLADEEFMDELTKTRSFRTSYQLPNGRGVFPREGYGFQAGQEAPSFPQKKRAKQFAAKCALAWLDDNPDWPEVGSSTKDTPMSSSNDKPHHSPPLAKSSSPLSKKVKVEDAEDHQGARITPAPSNTKARFPLPASSSEDETSATSVLQDVNKLAKQLGFDPPRYMVEHHLNGTYSAKPVFQLDGRMPEGLGVVTGAATEHQAKRDAAQKVLVWLQEKEKSVQADLDQVLGDVTDGV
ncbi:hypothetical protein B0T10DRAFT_602424 [Thelonectria olida]|uniref:DRBM domain-containing protein n=1 Tax=Thelonectria olida TaxID=1576542 RepID=A0A9P9ARS0_9HYPO|nr:hypothetical protein B0T10DRAFT_602424 [Thelonectria olida]